MSDTTESTERPLKIFPQTTFDMKVKTGGATYAWTVRMPTAREIEQMPKRFQKSAMLKHYARIEADTKEFLQKIADLALIGVKDEDDPKVANVVRQIVDGYVGSPEKTKLDVMKDDTIEPLSFDEWIVGVVSKWAIPDYPCTPKNVLALIDAWPGLASDLWPLYVDTAQAVRKGNAKG